MSGGRQASAWLSRLLLLAAGLFLVLCAGAVLTVRAHADNDETRPAGSRLMTLYENGVERSFVTTAATVGEALKEVNVEVDPRDRVEPGLSEELVADSYTVNVYRARPLLVIDGTVRVVITTASQTPSQIASDAGLTLYDEDVTTRERSNNILADGAAERFAIKRATPFTLTLYGETLTVRTQTSTVGEMLREKNIVLGANDRTSAPLTTPITSDLRLRVWREGKQTMTRDEAVNFDVEQIQDANRPVGYRSVKTPGVKGERTVTYEVTIKDGKESSRKEIASVIKKQPKKQVEIVGAKPTFNGDFAAALAKLRACESGGNYRINTGNGYYGAYQYDIGTWGGYGGYPNAAAAPPAVQDQKVRETYLRRGWSPWPHCGAGLPDTYR